eukprot:5714727-Amphidinium_carterae.2
MANHSVRSLVQMPESSHIWSPEVAQLRQRSDRLELDLQPLEESLCMKRRINEKLKGELHDERACAERSAW